MEPDTIKAIEHLAVILGTTGNNIIEEYVKWYLISAVAWSAVGAALIVAGFSIRKERFDIPIVVFQIILVFFGVLFVIAFLPDIFAPEAIAIHGLLVDIRG